jgi:hypothetical protein
MSFSKADHGDGLTHNVHFGAAARMLVLTTFPQAVLEQVLTPNPSGYVTPSAISSCSLPAGTV